MSKRFSPGDALVPIPAGERQPGGPTHRLLKASPVVPTRVATEAQEALQTPHPARVPNQTENEALAVLGIRGADADYEGHTFDVLGHKYTPDWTIPVDDGVWDKVATAVEVKGEFVHSRDSRILFDAARLGNPSLTWIWARKRTTGRKGPRWEIEVYPATA